MFVLFVTLITIPILLKNFFTTKINWEGKMCHLIARNDGMTFQEKQAQGILAVEGEIVFLKMTASSPASGFGGGTVKTLTCLQKSNRVKSTASDSAVISRS